MGSAVVTTENPATPVDEIRRYVQVCMPDEANPGALPLTQRTVLACRAGQVVARVVELPAKSPEPAMAELERDLRLGKNVQFDPAGMKLLALTSGHIQLQSGKLWVEESLELVGSVDTMGGAVEYWGNVVIHKDVCDQAHVAVTGDVCVRGSVEAARLKIAGNLEVGHGICGKEHGAVEVTGNVTARFASNARIVAGGNILIARETTTSRIRCAGEFMSENGAVHGGHVSAGTALTCHDAGSAAAVQTILEIGCGPENYAAAAASLTAIDGSRKKANEIRAAVEPLMQNQKNLTPAQKEKATELLYLADEMEQKAQDLSKAILHQQSEVQRARGGFVQVLHTVHTGVIIHFPGAHARIATPLRGPVRIMMAPDGEPRIVAVDGRGHGTTVLPPLPVEAAQAALVSRLLAFK
jgi:uncharacterized protein